MENRTEMRTKRNLIIFTVLVLGFAALAAVIEPLKVPPGSAPGTAGLGQILWIAAPAAAMLLLRLIGGDGWKDFGVRPNFKGNGYWWLASILIFPGVLSLTVVFGLIIGGIEVDTNVLPRFRSLLLAALIPAMIKNLLEESAWRGYLAPRLYSLKLNHGLSHAIVGMVWGLWHLPFVFVFWPYLKPDMLAYFIPLLLLGTISQSVVYGEIRLATSSFLPAWVMHTIGNTLGNTLLLSGLVQFVPGMELWFSPGAEGIVSIVLMFATGYWLHQRNKESI
jgi:membrane protease YdiL (CAAX protease family)